MTQGESVLSADDVVFQSRLERFQGGAVLRLTGDLNDSTRPTMLQAFEDTLGLDARLVVIDLDGLRVMDSDGIGCLIEVKARADERGNIRIVILASNGPRRRTLTVMGLDKVFEIADDIAELAIEGKRHGVGSGTRRVLR